jgi:hypothetical protein
MNLFCFPSRFCPLRAIVIEKMATLTHITAHLQAHTSQRSNQSLAKELQFFNRTM